MMIEKLNIDDYSTLMQIINSKCTKCGNKFYSIEEAVNDSGKSYRKDKFDIVCIICGKRILFEIVNDKIKMVKEVS